MATEKNTIVIYRDWHTIFDKLTDEEAGKLIKHLFNYVNDNNPKSERLIELIFEPIKATLKRDLKAWEQVKEKKVNSAKLGNLKRWNKELYDKVMLNEMSIDEAEKIAYGRTAIGCDNNNRTPIKSIANVAVSVSDSVSVSVIEKNNTKKVPTFEEFKKYVQENDNSVNIQALEMKYKSWVENSWKDGYNKPIKNWKSKILNNLQFLKHDSVQEQTNKTSGLRYLSLEDKQRKGLNPKREYVFSKIDGQEYAGLLTEAEKIAKNIDPKKIITIQNHEINI